MAGIDEQLRIREMATAGNPQAAQQKYAQSKDLMDLLVAQKVSNDYASARNAMQAATQTSANPIIDQLDMSNAQVTKNDMMRSLMPGVAIKAGRDQQAMQRQAMGIPTQPAPNIRMADGGIVGYAPGGGVKDLENQLEKIARIEEGRFYQPRTGRNGAGEQVETDKNYVVPDAEYGGGTYASAGPRTMLMNLISGNKGQMRQSEYDAILEQLATLQAQEAQKTRKAAIEQDIRRQERQPAFFNKGGIVGYQQGGGVKRFQEGLSVARDDESRFGITTDNELSPEEAQELDRQRRFVAAQERATRLGEAAKEDVSGILNALVNLPSTVTGSLYNLATQPNAATRLMQRGAEASGIAPFMRGAGAPAMPTPDPAYGFFRGDAKPEPKDEAQAQTSGTPLGNRAPSKDARREQVADPFDVKGMVDRLVEPEFRMQGVLDAPQIKGPAKKKGMFDNVDIGRLQAFLAGGGGQTSTASALGGGLRGLMGEDQRREALVSKEAIEAAKINSQRYGIEQDFNAAMAKIGAEDRKMLFNAQADILRERLGGDIAAARDALDDMENSAVYQNEFMRLSAEYEDQPEVLRARACSPYR